MAGSSKIMYNPKAISKIQNADDLEKALHIADSRLWIVLCVCALFFVGFLAWGVFGSVASTVSVRGVKIGGEIHCFLTTRESSGIDENSTVSVDGCAAQVLEVSAVPLSRNEARDILGSDYLVSELVREDWAYHVTVGGDGSLPEDGDMAEIRLTTRSMPPVLMILGGDG